MSRRTNHLLAALLRVYPRQWRDQYGDEQRHLVAL